MNTSHDVLHRRDLINGKRCLSLQSPKQSPLSLPHWQAERAANKHDDNMVCYNQQHIRLDKETAAHQDSNEPNMINRLMLGMVGKLCRHLTVYQLEQVAFLEHNKVILLNADMPFANRKEQLTAMLATCFVQVRDGHWECHTSPESVA